MKKRISFLSTLLLSTTLLTGCGPTKEEPKPLKFAIFADIQLCGESKVDGKAVLNEGATANAPIALKNHLQFCKNKGVDAILMNGDITNQANEYYYSFYEKILKEVYGEESEENPYPEFVMNMGNHEWWWGTTEKEGGGDAVKMFKSHARISSNNLKRESAVAYQYSEQGANTTLPSYYKVINGIPFLVVSGIDSNGDISSSLQSELTTWMGEIKALPSVKKGGPVFVEYHEPLTTSMTHGQGSHKTYCEKLENLLADVPNAVVFTGDTHFPGINERSINQVDFTTINLGSSSYSRMISNSATKKSFANVAGTSSKDKLVGAVKFKEAYTPTIQIVEVAADSTFKIDRYFTEEDGTGRKVGDTWNFGLINSKEDFVYTNARFQNKASAQALYGADGLSWDEDEDSVVFGVDPNTHRATVRFPDVTDHHYVEHYGIKINNTTNYFVSNYYKYPEERQDNYYVIDNVPESANYQVTVTAYDFFDNPSLNTLVSTTNDLTKTLDPIDYQVSLTYSDIQMRNSFSKVKEGGSQSSVEYYYKGNNLYNYGTILSHILRSDGGVDCSDYLTIKGKENVAPVITCDVYNANESAMSFGPCVVDSSGKWLTDFGVEYQKEAAPKTWTHLSWNLYELFSLKGYSSLRQVSLKAKLKNATPGYEMSFFVDNIDIGYQENPKPVRHSKAFESGKDLTYNVSDIGPSDTLTIDIKITDAEGTAAIMVGNWKHYYGYFKINASGSQNKYNGVSFYTTDDGFTRLIIDLSKVTRKDDTEGSSATVDKVDFIYVRGAWTNVSGEIEVNPEVGEIVRGLSFSSGNQLTYDVPAESQKTVATDTLNIDIKFNESGSDKYIRFMIGGWSAYFGYFKIFADGRLNENYAGVTITKRDDGYYRVTFVLKDVTKVEDMPKPETIALLFVNNNTNVSGLIDFNPSVA